MIEYLPHSLRSRRQVGAIREIEWHEVIVDNGAGSKVVLGQGSFGVVVNAIWNGRRVAVKVITPSDDLDADEAHDVCCLAAETEAEMITKAEQGLDSQELMVKLYGIVRGALPAEVTERLRLIITAIVIAVAMKE